MMKEWKEVKLNDVFHFYNGKAIKVKETGEYPVYGSNGLIGYSDVEKFNNSIIIGRVGAYCGAVFYEKNKFWASDNTIVVKNKDDYDIEYLAYHIDLINLNWFSGGSAQPLLTHGWLKSIKIIVPPLPTQRKIAKILSAYDELIENNLKRIKLLEEMAQNEFNEWYANNEDFEEVNLGSIIGHEIGGGWGAEEQSEEFSKPAFVIRGTDIDELPNGKIENVPFRFHKKSNLASRKLQDGDIIFEVSGGSSYEGVAKTLLVTDELLKQFDNAVMSASFCKLARPTKKEYSIFLFLFLRFLRNIKGTEVFEIRSASNIVNYNWTAFLKFQKINKPSKTELEEFNQKIEPIYKQVYNLGNQNQRLKEARDILLPRLMTGMIDVDSLLIQEETKIIPITKEKKKEANWQFKEAVLISVLTEKYGSEQYPLGRKRYTKLSYLFHRNVDNEIRRYSRQAAGMYNSQTKYKGPENIALKNNYIKMHKSGRFSGFVIDENIAEANKYYQNYWNDENMKWLEQFRYKSNDELGLYSVVDNALLELYKNNIIVNVEEIKSILKREKEWQPKLEQSVYSDNNIIRAISQLSNLFDYEL